MNNQWFPWIWGCLLWAGPAFGQFIDIRMSVKVIVHPTTGVRPLNITDQVINTAVNNANNWMAGYLRGYRFGITELVSIGGPLEGGTNGPSKWFGRNFRGGTEWNQFYGEAQNDARYRLRSDQINIYVATDFAAPGNSGGAMPIPPGGLDTGGQIFVDDGAWWVVHELGHFFGLNHTFGGCECGGSCVYPATGDDGIADTLPEGACWTIDQITQKHYSMSYNALTNSAVTNALHRQWQENVDNTYFNVMSYHEAVNKNIVENRMTELQMDQLTTIANWYRRPFVSGFTRFVSTTGVNSGGGTNSAAPFRTVEHGVNMANAGRDILLLRPGNYNEQLTISKRVTIRATRAGWATIGKP